MNQQLKPEQAPRSIRSRFALAALSLTLFSCHPVFAKDQQYRFVSAVLGLTEKVWHHFFQMNGKQYIEPKLVLYRGTTHSACVQAQAAMGPFYCGLDQKVYLDDGFFDELDKKFGAPGDMAKAYVIAHEVGHHIQNQLGIINKIRAMQVQSMSEVRANQLQVRLELHADCLAGTWAKQAHLMRDIIEPGDMDDMVRAAGAIGDDTLQKKIMGVARPETFTHGTSEQRQRWLMKGFNAGNPQACQAVFQSVD